MRNRLGSALVLAVGIAAVVRADSKPPSTEAAQVAQLKDAKWAAPKAPGIPAGVLGAPIAVDPQSGGSVGYAQIPAGTVIPSHWHSAPEYSVLVSGRARFTLDGKDHELEPGSYFVVPAQVRHQLACAAGAECVLITRRAGPTDYHFDK